MHVGMKPQHVGVKPQHKPPTPIQKVFSQNEHAMWVSTNIITCPTPRSMWEYLIEATKHQNSILAMKVFSPNLVSPKSSLVSHIGSNFSSNNRSDTVDALQSIWFSTPSITEVNIVIWHGLFLEYIFLLEASCFRDSFLASSTHDTFLKILEDSSLPLEGWLSLDDWLSL